MKKAFDQTVRDIKRGVNKKVLKVPSIEQKVLDATSNEPWGPHGSLLADIAQASRNYHEYQMIMSVIWKRVNDTGKNWRHVYKGLTVLEYLVANGSERVVDEIREHAYQISTLSDFQYIDSTGRDQGNNVRKKSQSLVALVNDKERIQEVRQKAAANWDKFHNTSGGGKYRPGSYPGPGGYDDGRYEGRYGSRDEDRNGDGREREWGDDKYGRYGDSYSRDGEERYGRDGYRDEETRGRRSVDGDNYGRRSRSSDRDRERAYEDDGQYSSRHLEQKSPEQNLGGPPSYEDVVADGRSPAYSERDGETKLSPPPASTAHETTVAPAAAAPPPVAATLAPLPVAATLAPPAATLNKESDGFDEFDPRGSYPAAMATLGGAEMDLFGSLSDSFSSNALALVPSTTESATTTSEANAFTDSNPPAQTFVAASSASTGSTQPFNDPFGDGPFRAVPSTDGFVAQPQSTSAFGQSAEPPQPIAPTLESGNSFGYGGGFDQNTDILADLLPPSGPSQAGFQAQPGQLPSQTSFPDQPNQTTFQSSFPGQSSFQGGQPTPQPSFPSQDGQLMLQHGFPPQGGQNMSQPGFPPHGGQTMPPGGFPSQMGSVSQAGFPVSNGQPAHPNNFYGGFQPQGTLAPVPAMSQVTATPAAQSNTSNFFQQPQVQSGSALASSQPVAVTFSTGALAIVPQQPAKFETKSTVWADTLNRGLVDLNISGSKTNPLSNIGVDFEALNRKEKRMEKPSTTPMTSNVTMGKAMGSGSGIGRAGAGALRAQPNLVMGSSMGGPGAAPGHGAGYGGINQPLGQYQMQYPAAGFPPGSAMPGPYNPMMGGGGGYGQQPYGGSYR